MINAWTYSNLNFTYLDNLHYKIPEILILILCLNHLNGFTYNLVCCFPYFRLTF